MIIPRAWLLIAAMPIAVLSENGVPSALAQTLVGGPGGRARNLDETKVGPYTLPDPLVLQNGQVVRDADTWLKQRRPEIIRHYENEVFGRVPERAPKVAWEIVETEAGALDGKAMRKLAVGKFGEGEAALKVRMNLYLPANARGPVPVILHLSFYSDSAQVPTEAENVAANRPSWARPTEIGPTADMLARGYGYAILRYTDIQPDVATSNAAGVQALAYAPGQTKPAADEWGAISVWAWAASRALDFLATDRAVDAQRIALVGFSRLGKTALWAGGRDPRFALVFAACAGEMGSALSRRDFGETVDDIAARFPRWFAGNFQKYPGHWSALPVDAHSLIALNAPHPVFLTAGTQDLGADPRGEFLAAVAAGPVYRLLGKKDLGSAELPPTEIPLITGSLGFYYHTGPHVVSPADWKVFLEFADLHLKPR